MEKGRSFLEMLPPSVRELIATIFSSSAQCGGASRRDFLKCVASAGVLVITGGCSVVHLKDINIQTNFPRRLAAEKIMEHGHEAYEAMANNTLALAIEIDGCLKIVGQAVVLHRPSRSGEKVRAVVTSYHIFYQVEKIYGKKPIYVLPYRKDEGDMEWPIGAAMTKKNAAVIDPRDKNTFFYDQESDLAAMPFSSLHELPVAINPPLIEIGDVSPRENVYSLYWQRKYLQSHKDALVCGGDVSSYLNPSQGLVLDPFSVRGARPVKGNFLLSLPASVGNSGSGVFVFEENERGELIAKLVGLVKLGKNKIGFGAEAIGGKVILDFLKKNQDAMDRSVDKNIKLR